MLPVPAQLARVVGKIARFIPGLPGIRGGGKLFAQLIMHIGIGGHGGAHIDANGCGIDQLDLGDAVRHNRAYMLRQLLAVDGGVQAGNQAFQHKGGLAGAGNPGHHSQPPLGNFDVQRLYGVDGVGGKLNAPQREQLALRGLGSQALRFARQERPNAGSSVCFNGRDAALGNHLAAARTGLRPHLNQPIGFG